MIASIKVFLSLRSACSVGGIIGTTAGVVESPEAPESPAEPVELLLAEEFEEFAASAAAFFLAIASLTL